MGKLKKLYLAKEKTCQVNLFSEAGFCFVFVFCQKLTCSAGRVQGKRISDACQLHYNCMFKLNL